MSEKKKSTYERNRIILKSFLSNIKNYIMLFSCFVLCVSVIFTFISTYQMSAKLQNIRLFNYTIGIGEIVYDAAMLMGALTILLTVFSIRHYERLRASDYEIFRTLGMPWNFARLLKGIEYVGGTDFITSCRVNFGKFIFVFTREMYSTLFSENRSCGTGCAYICADDSYARLDFLFLYCNHGRGIYRNQFPKRF